MGVTQLPARGDVWWCEAATVGRRPVVVLTRDATIRARHRVVVAHCSRVIRGIETEVPLEPGEDPVAHPSVVALDSLAEYPISALTQRLGRVSDVRMDQICAALKIAVDCR